ncbi:MAG: hypothetical protein ACE5JH_12355, partial [Acidobacteriota bacterium]
LGRLRRISPARPRPPAEGRGLEGRDRAQWDRLAATVAREYFARPGAERPTSGGGAPSGGIDVDWQLIASYLRRHRDEVNFVDIDECASPEEAIGRLRVLVDACRSARGRVLAR